MSDLIWWRQALASTVSFALGFGFVYGFLCLLFGINPRDDS